MNKKVNEILRYCLAGIIVFGFFVLLYILLFKAITPANENILNIVIGALIGSFTTIIGYFFGSSSGSAEKTKLLTEINETKTEIKPEL
jgi:heme O synthase-like polyprenyltransferase